MITVGSISRDDAVRIYPFLAPRYRGRRKAIRELTHRDPDFVFWIFPDGRLHDARESHRKNVPRGFEHIADDTPEYGGFLRGRIVSRGGHQLVVVYCRSDALAAAGPALQQLLSGLSHVPVPLHTDALVISDNGDVYGTVSDLRQRQPDGGAF